MQTTNNLRTCLPDKQKKPENKKELPKTGNFQRPSKPSTSPPDK